MMAPLELTWHAYDYFPYERRLASQEVKTLLDAEVISERDDVLIVNAETASLDQLRRLTYFRAVELPNGDRLVPDQARLEFSARHGGDVPVEGDWQLHRQSTRYSVHGIHEYKGKFNPQIVRAIGNRLGLGAGAWVLDPYCGSGTTLVEAAHLGWHAVGVDMNPLAEMIANAKLTAIRTPVRTLDKEARALLDRLDARFGGCDFTEAWSATETNELVGDPSWLESLPNASYLRKWFPVSVLAQLALMLAEIESRVSPKLRSLFKVFLSDIARQVSLQDPDDLRIRRRKDPADNYDAVGRFSKAVRASLDAIRRAQAVHGIQTHGQRAFHADSRDSLDWIRTKHEAAGFAGFNAAITSPPYATALPYIDTQRLSLALLGLVPSDEISTLEREIIGSRELLTDEQRKLEAAIESDDREIALPDSVLSLCREMKVEASKPDNGFRRRAKPAIVYRYFIDSARVFARVRDVMEPRGQFALVVGRNSTTLGGTEFVIDTPELLADVAEVHGWRLADTEELDTYPRFDMHQSNSIRTEQLIVLQAAEGLRP